MLDPEDPKLGQKTYFLRTFKKPDDDFILLYVYGSVVDGMSGYHALAHLVDDNLVQKVQPLEMSAVSVSKDKLPASGLSRSTDAPPRRMRPTPATATSSTCSSRQPASSVRMEGSSTRWALRSRRPPRVPSSART